MKTFLCLLLSYFRFVYLFLGKTSSGKQNTNSQKEGCILFIIWCCLFLVLFFLVYEGRKDDLVITACIALYYSAKIKLEPSFLSLKRARGWRT